jgi:RHS repeat-associated protein
MNFLGGIPGVPNLSIGTYDAEGRPTQINASSAPTVVASAISYGPFGATSVTYATGDYDTFAYDNLGHMTLYQTTDPSYGQYQGSLIWNPNGTLKSLSTVDTIPGGGSDPSTTVTYHYDDLARLIYASDGVNLSQTYSYDRYGNISTSGSPQSWMPTYASPNTNQYQPVSTCGNSGAIGYDMDGNLLCDSFNIYTWNAENKLTSVNTNGHGNNSSNRYDGLNRQVENSSSAVTYERLYAPGLGPVALMFEQNTAEADIPLPGGGKAIYSPYYGGINNGYTHTDWRGDVRLSTSQWGGLSDELSRIAYSPFGEEYNINAGESWFDSTSLSVAVPNAYDMPNRTLHGIQGRWLNPDPAGRSAVDPSNPQTWNRYVYAGNDPLKYRDPAGLDFYLNCENTGPCQEMVVGYDKNGNPQTASV